jgi:hypothetical protein
MYKPEMGLERAYASWRSEPMAGEIAEAYVKRSVQEACGYVQSYIERYRLFRGVSSAVCEQQNSIMVNSPTLSGRTR